MPKYGLMLRVNQYLVFPVAEINGIAASLPILQSKSRKKEEKVQLDAQQTQITENENQLEMQKSEIMENADVLAEHRLSYLSGLADRIVYLKAGRIEREFTAAEFAGLPESERSAMCLRSIRSEEIKIPERMFMQPNASLAVHHISVQRKKRLILNDLSLSANDGDIIGIVGKNGSGKSTLCQQPQRSFTDCQRRSDFLRQEAIPQSKNQAVRYGDAGCQPSAFFGQCEKRVLVGQSECHQSGD